MTTQRQRRITATTNTQPVPLFDSNAPWMAQDAPTVPCAENPDWWYADHHNGENRLLQNAARNACADCPLRSDCLEWALENDERWGIWGGLDPEERHNLRRRRKRTHQRPPGVVLDEWVFLRDQGYTVQDAAEQLGIRRDSLSKAMLRARRRGDPRGASTRAAR